MNIQSMPVYLRTGYAGRHIITQVEPALEYVHALITGNGALSMHALGRLDHEEITFCHEEMQAPQWKNPPKAPMMAESLDLIRKKMLDGEYKAAAEFADMAASQGGTPPYFTSNPDHPALKLHLDQQFSEACNYIHTLNMNTGEIRLHWEHESVQFERRMFCSRTDHIACIMLNSSETLLNVDIRGEFPEIKYKRGGWDHNMLPSDRSGLWDCIAEPPMITQQSSIEHILIDGIYAYERGGFAEAIYVVQSEGSRYISDDKIQIRNAKTVLIFFSCERYTSLAKVVSSSSLLKKLKEIYSQYISYQINMDCIYNLLLERHCKKHAEFFSRLEINLGGDPEDYLLSTIELKQKQLLSQEIIPAYAEAMVDMGRFFLIVDSGKFPPIFGHVNVNVNHQISCGNIASLPEMMESFFQWIEHQLPNARENAKRILGTRGFLIATHPDQESGNLYHFNEFYPHEYWISSSGWCLNPFLEYFYCTADEKFMRSRVLPLYAELAEFYEDFLSVRDENGYRMFIPSYSPENFPSNIPSMQVINATMDIQVCHEVLSVLLKWGPEYSNFTNEDYQKWRTMLDELPPYLYGRYGELKEWARDEYEERYDHRHASHLYACYPGDEAQPDLNPELYKGSLIANRMRALGNESCHGLMHRAQAAARLKDAWLVQKLLRFVLEAGYVTDAFTTVHNPYLKNIFPDGQGAFPTVVLECLVYSRPGVIELLPALPSGSFQKGSLQGMASRSFTIIKNFEWDVEQGKLRLELRSLRRQKLEVRTPDEYENITVTLNKEEIRDLYFERIS